MNSVSKRIATFDTWVQSGPFTVIDLALYRIFYSVSVICVAPSIQWLSEYPNSMYQPPVGLFQIFDGFPSPTALTVLELFRTFALVLLAVGFWTKWSSIAVSIALLVTYGYTYTLGKIDHTILLVLTPLVLAWSGWGDRLSADAFRRRSKGVVRCAQWPLRLLALLVGLCFFEAAAIKILTGWLSVSNQAARGHFFENLAYSSDVSAIAAWIAQVTYTPAWELLDWLTVILEAGILLTVPWWRAFRIALSCATLFHLSVFILMDIRFASNLIVYAAFVSWGSLAFWRCSRSTSSHATRLLSSTLSREFVLSLLILVGLASGLALWWLSTKSNLPTAIVGVITIFGGAGLGVGYILRQILVVGKRASRQVSRLPTERT